MALDNFTIDSSIIFASFHCYQFPVDLSGTHCRVIIHVSSNDTFCKFPESINLTILGMANTTYRNLFEVHNEPLRYRLCASFCNFSVYLVEETDQ